MSTPTTSAAPQSPTGSSLLRPISSITEWWGYIRTWILGLSPAGSTVYETGWEAIEIASGHELSRESPLVKRIGKVIYVRGGIKPVSGSFINTAWVKVGTMPAAFAPSYWQRSQSAITVGGNSGFTGTAQVTVSGEILVRIPAGVTVENVELKGISGYLLG